MPDLSPSAISIALAKYPGGVALAELHSVLDTGMTVRTLQRHLAVLAKQGLVRIAGRGRATRYFPAAKTSENLPSDSLQAISLSIRGQQVLNLVEQPLDRRPKAGYDPLFLRDYGQRNDGYLSSAERSHLLKLGQSTRRQEEAAGTYARHILQRLLIDLSWNSSRLEGNTYSLLDTQQLLEKGHATDEKSAEETQMILNHKDAIEFLVDAAADIDFNRYTLLNLHALLSNNLLPDPAASGRLRTFAVGITKSTYTPPGLPQQIEEFFDLFLAKIRAIQDPFEQAFFAMVHIPYLQPFEDVNKRVSRLAANIPLNRLNLAPLSFVDVPRDLYVKGLLGIYEQRDPSLLKDVFLFAYERSAARYAEVRQTLGDPDPFRIRYRDAIRRIISEVITQQLPPVDAKEHLLHFARQLPAADQDNFINVVEAELLALHEGNFARYKVTPSQFAAWQSVWGSIP
jgi:Fic family protein